MPSAEADEFLNDGRLTSWDAQYLTVKRENEAFD